MAAKSFRLDQPTTIIRGADGKFQEPAAPTRPLPPNQLAIEANGGQPSEWAPGIGQGTAPISSEPIPWPPADTGIKPYKLGG